MEPVDSPTGVSATEAEAVRGLVRVSAFLEKSSAELSLAHYRVLSAISSGDERASRIARRLALGKPTVSAAVASLCQRGLLERSGVEGDLRATDLRLTAAGRAVLERMETEMIRRLEQVVSRTTEAAAVVDALARLAPAIEEVVAERAARRFGPAGG